MYTKGVKMNTTKKQITKKIFVGVIICLTFLKCASTLGIKEGVIISKKIEAKEDFYLITSIPHGKVNGNVSETYFTNVVSYMNDAEGYRIDVKGINSTIKDTITQTFYLNKAQFDFIRVGDHIKIDY